MGFWSGLAAILGAVPGIISLWWQIRKSKHRLDIKVAYRHSFMSDDYRTISSVQKDGFTKKRCDVVARITNLSDFDVILDYAFLVTNGEVVNRENIYILEIQHEEGRLGSMDRTIQTTYPVRLTPGEWYIFDDFDVNPETLNKYPSLEFGVKLTTCKKPFQVQISEDEYWQD